MAQYNCKVMDKNGKTKKIPAFDAPSVDKAREKLKAEGYIIQEIKEVGVTEGKANGKVKDRDLAVFCKQFVAVLNAGVTVITALEMMADQMDNKRLKNALKEAQTYVQKGGTLADGFRLNPKTFPPIMINMTAAGEMSGSLETAFERLTTHFENNNKLKSKVKGAMTYPCVILLVVTGVVILLLAGVVPQFEEMFRDLGSDLPAATKLLVSMSNFIKSKWYILIAIVAIVVTALVMFGKTEGGAQLYAKIAIKAPLFGNLVVKSSAATFSRTMCTLMGAGVPLMDSIEQVAKMQGNKIIREGLLDAKVQVAKGVPLSKPVRDMDIYPNMLPQMIRIGEETGNIEDMLEKVADYYEMEVNNATDALTAAMEPLIIVIMGVVVGGIVLAIYSPMLSMYDAVDNY